MSWDGNTNDDKDDFCSFTPFFSANNFRKIRTPQVFSNHLWIYELIARRVRLMLFSGIDFFFAFEFDFDFFLSFNGKRFRADTVHNKHHLCLHTVQSMRCVNCVLNKLCFYVDHLSINTIHLIWFHLILIKLLGWIFFQKKFPCFLFRLIFHLNRFLNEQIQSKSMSSSNAAIFECWMSTNLSDDEIWIVNVEKLIRNW